MVVDSSVSSPGSFLSYAASTCRSASIARSHARIGFVPAFRRATNLATTCGALTAPMPDSANETNPRDLESAVLAEPREIHPRREPRGARNGAGVLPRPERCERV